MFQQATQPVTRAAEHSDTTEEPKVRTEEEASGMLESLARQLMTNVQFEMPEKEGEGGAFPARAVLRQAGKNTPLLSRQSLPVAETITDADEALLQRAGEETEAEVMPGAVPTKEGEALQYESSHYSEVQPYDVDLSRHRVGVSPQPEKADSEMRVVSIDIKPGDRPFSKWEAMHPDGHLQLVNVEEDAGLAPVKVRKVTRVIGGGVAVANPPQPEMVEAQLPVAVPVYADARTQVVTENIVPNAGIKTPLPIVIKAPVGVSSAASAPLPERRPVQSPSMPDVPGSIPREVVDVYQPRLSRETKQALEGLPAGLGTPKPQDTQPPLDVARRNVPDMEVVEGDVDMREAKGVQIAVKRPDFNADTYMEDAYHALMQGDLPTAMDRYQAVLEAQPNNTDAKFGLATTYHRRGELAMARSLYAEIIMVNRHHLEALNNLLVLVSQESPSEALAEMKKLEARNPDFGPIPAQMAALYAKNDAIDDAIASIQRAIHIDPTNLAYRYNGAVLMDRAGRREEAIEYYTSLKHSYERGEKVPANMAAIQERLTFLLSNRG